MAKTTGPIRQILKNHAPAWIDRRIGERVRSLFGLIGDMILESVTSAQKSNMLAEKSHSPPDGVARVAADRRMPRFKSDNTDTHRNRVLKAFDIWSETGTREFLKQQIELLGFPNARILSINEAEENPNYNRAFLIILDYKVTEQNIIDIFNLVTRYKAAEERIEDIISYENGRFWDYHPATGGPHTWDSPGPGVEFWDSDDFITYRGIIGS